MRDWTSARLLGWVAMWRNVTDMVAPAAAVNNSIFPLWMIVFGGGLFRLGGIQSRFAKRISVNARGARTQQLCPVEDDRNWCRETLIRFNHDESAIGSDVVRRRLRTLVV